MSSSNSGLLLAETEPSPMTKDEKPDPQKPEEPDPLSATAMFLRALGDSPQAKQEMPGQVREKFGAGPGATSTPAQGTLPRAAGPVPPATTQPAAGPGEFTQTFGDIRKRQISSDEHAAERAKGAPSAPSSTPPSTPRHNDPPGEFTRIFVKGAATPRGRTDESPQPMKSEPSARATGFSSPGVSDAASGDSTFTQFFKATTGASAQSSASDPVREASSSGAFDAGANPAQPGEPLAERSSSPAANQSITQMLAHLSSEKQTAPRSSDAEVVPYGQEPRRTFLSEPASAPPAGVDPGGVTQMMKRLSPEPARPVLDSIPVLPKPAAPKTGPGEFTQMMSREKVNAAIGAAAAAPAAQAAPAAPSSPFMPVTPATPQLKVPVVAAPPIAAPAPAAHPAQFVTPVAPAMPAIPAIPAAAMYAPPKPAAPAPPAIAAPKGKLEAMVPYLLLVNTFLLVLLLIVVVFLIKAR